MHVIAFLSSREHLSILLIFILLWIASVSPFLSSFISDSTGNSFQLKTSDKPLPCYSSSIKQTPLATMLEMQGCVWQRNGQAGPSGVGGNEKKRTENQKQMLDWLL